MTHSSSRNTGRPFGRVLTAMVSPFDENGAVEPKIAQEVATRLIDSGNDGIVVNGTTGESPTTSDREKDTLIRAVVEAVGDRATVVAGVSTYDTAHSRELARQAQRAGAHGLMAVTPYYSRPSQEGVYAHFTAIADATDLPVLLYDIPVRAGVPIEVDTLLRLAEHSSITAVKDAKGDFLAGSRVMAETGLAYYSGDDPLHLPWLSVGAVGFVSVIGHVVADRLRIMLDAHESGDPATARAAHRALLPVYRVLGRVGGVGFAKTALSLTGLEAGAPRLPIAPVTDAERALIAEDLMPVLE
ncbi:4-hydroxy-tetrahydrodipicolinate synthase [Streptomyces sp. NPDC093097]|uniref:4-hydroxy-tetrahydrodipicolinate synthase n=1 Tax=Streptomyces sp. NPDC093097 TaxID=3366027 RepID=UPI0038091A2E